MRQKSRLPNLSKRGPEAAVEAAAVLEEDGVGATSATAAAAAPAALFDRIRCHRTASGSTFGKLRIGKTAITARIDAIKNPIHHAPTHFGSDSSMLIILKFTHHENIASISRAYLSHLFTSVIYKNFHTLPISSHGL